jgi:hypothetical protein
MNRVAAGLQTPDRLAKVRWRAIRLGQRQHDQPPIWVLLQNFSNHLNKLKAHFQRAPPLTHGA